MNLGKKKNGANYCVRYPAFFAFYLDMVLVEALDNRVSEELIVRSNALPLLSRPLHVLLPPSKAVVAVHEAQYHLNPMLPCLRQHEIQPLDEHRREKKRDGNASAHEQSKENKNIVYFKRKKKARTSQETEPLAQRGASGRQVRPRTWKVFSL